MSDPRAMVAAMAKKQTRRSISISRKTYDRVLAHSKAIGLSMSSLTENMLEAVVSLKDPVVMSAAEADAFRRAVQGDNFDTKLTDAVIRRMNDFMPKRPQTEVSDA